MWQSLPAERLGDADLVPQLGDHVLRVGYVKAFMDGTLGSRTARLLDGSGVEITSGARPRRARPPSRGAPASRSPCTPSATGPTATRSTPSRRPRTLAPPACATRIEHAQCIAPEDVAALRRARRRRLGAVHPRHRATATSSSAIWADRVEHAYPYRSLLGAGARLAAARTRRSRSSTRSRACAPPCCAPTTSARRGAGAGDPAPRRSSLHVAPAWLSCDEHRRGRLRAGFDADLVVLDRDPLAHPPASVADARLVATMVAGEWVHGPGWVSRTA